MWVGGQHGIRLAFSMSLARRLMLVAADSACLAPVAAKLVRQAELLSMLLCLPSQTSPVWPTIDAAPGAALNITNSKVQMYPNKLCSQEQIALAVRNIAALAGRADAAVPDGLTGRFTALSLQLPVANASGAAGQPPLYCTRTLLGWLAAVIPPVPALILPSMPPHNLQWEPSAIFWTIPT